MDRSTLCPTCLSKYPDIRGMVYPYGHVVGHRCEDARHVAPDYDPNVLILSDEDREIMAELFVQVEPKE